VPELVAKPTSTSPASAAIRVQRPTLAVRSIRGWQDGHAFIGEAVPWGDIIVEYPAQ
jgi:hypothetical protein